MYQLRVGIQLASLRLPLRKAIQKAAELGAQAVEIDARGELKPRDLSQSALRQIRKMLEDYNLNVCAVGLHTRRGYNVPDDLDGRVNATREAMEFAFRLGASVVVNQIGHIPDQSQGQSWDLLVETLADIGRYGQRVGAVLAARTGAESGEDLARLIDALPEGAIGVDFDPGNLTVNGHTASEALQVLGRQVRHVHATDGVRDLAIGRGLQTPLGEGVVDFPHLLGILEEHRYRGYLTVEKEMSANPSLEIKQAVDYLRRL